MQLPLEITFRGIDRSPAIEQQVRERAARLDKLYDRIMRCHVVIDASHRRRQHGNTYLVRLDITVPGSEIVVNRDPAKNRAHEDAYVAVRDAFSAAARQLEDHARRLRGRVKSHDVPSHGRVIRLFPNEDCGFLESSDGLEIYFHKNSVVDGAFPRLSVGSEVRFVLADGEGEKGPQASTVRSVGKHHVA